MTVGRGYSAPVGSFGSRRALGDERLRSEARLGHSPRSGGPCRVLVPDLRAVALEAFVRFEYPDDLFDGNFPEFVGREQELFTWFNLVGRCQQCFRMLPVAD